jgi:hypothetical protein
MMMMLSSTCLVRIIQSVMPSSSRITACPNLRNDLENPWLCNRSFFQKSILNHSGILRRTRMKGRNIFRTKWISIQKFRKIFLDSFSNRETQMMLMPLMIEVRKFHLERVFVNHFSMANTIWSWRYLHNVGSPSRSSSWTSFWHSCTLAPAYIASS